MFVSVGCFWRVPHLSFELTCTVQYLVTIRQRWRANRQRVTTLPSPVQVRMKPAAAVESPSKVVFRFVKMYEQERKALIPSEY